MDLPLFGSSASRFEAARARADEASARAEAADADADELVEELCVRLSSARRAASRPGDGLEARLERLRALRDYWTARAGLELAAGGTIEP